MTGIVDALGAERSLSYNANSNVTTFTSPETTGTATANFGYDASNNLESVQRPTGATDRFAYTAPSNPFAPSSQTDPQGNATDFGYDPLGRLQSVTDRATGDQLTVAYNANGTMQSATDRKGFVTSYTYLPSGDLQRIDYDNRLPFGDPTFTYDTVSRVKTTTDGRGKTATFDYDKLDRVTKVTYQDGSSISYTFDRAGNRRTMSDNTGLSTYDYDLLNRLTKETLSGGKINSYAYDAVGNLTSHSDVGGGMSYQYNQVNLLTKATEPDGQFTTFTYDPADRRNVTTYPNSVTQDADYDASGRLTRLVGKTQAGIVLTDFTYTYADPFTNADTDLRQTVRDKDGRLTDYDYGASNRLIHARTTTSAGAQGSDYQYAYDPAGNRTSRTIDGATTAYTYTGNMLETAGGVNYGATGHDGAGNVTANSAGFAATYNDKTQAVSVKALTDGTPLAMTYTDQTQVKRTAAGPTAFTHTGLGVTATTDGTSTTSYRRDNQGNLLGQKLPTESKQYYLSDGLGSIIALTAPNGAVTNRYEYGPYGEARLTSETVPNPWRYIGGYLDTQTGLYKFGFRYYSPELGRFLQPDPANNITHDYTYAAGNPVNFTDLTGLRSAAGVYGIACGVGAIVAGATAFATGGLTLAVAAAVVQGCAIQLGLTAVLDAANAPEALARTLRIDVSLAYVIYQLLRA